MTFHRLLPFLSALLLVLSSLPGCRRSDRPRVLSAEFQDETPDGLALQNESIYLRLDGPLPPSLSLGGIRVRSIPPVAWTPGAARLLAPNTLEVKIVTGTPAFRLAGVHGQDEGATGLGVDLGDGVEQWVDLQAAPSLPVLERAVWEDSGPGWEDTEPVRGNLVVDGGDSIRLIFDRPVKLAVDSPATARVRSPQDVILSKANDRLDDGSPDEDGLSHARFEEGSDEREVRIVLGSRPVLTIGGVLGAGGAPIERFRTSAPSGIALNGTPILPMPRIVDARGGDGAISTREIDIEYPEGLELPRKRIAEVLPPPGHLRSHTVTPIVGSRALIAGGASAEGLEATDHVLVHDPFHAERGGAQAFILLEERLPHPVYDHTATPLAGPDGVFGTFDDVILVAGGADGDESLPDLTVLVPQDDGGASVIPLEGGLRIARSGHAAAATSQNQILVDGGEKSGTAGLVECAELITIGFEDGRPRIAEHTVFRTFARIGHSLTLLPPAEDGTVYVLAHGGSGRSRRRSTPASVFGEPVLAITPDLFFPSNSAAVLSSPVLINIAAPAKSISLSPEFHLAHLRWGHAGVSITPAAPGRKGTRGPNVLIAGGTSRPFYRQRFERDRRLWDLPIDALRLPEGHEAASPILFRFDAAEPSRSRFEILPAPTGDVGQAVERVHFAVTEIPGKALLFTGGESADGTPLSSAEVYLFDLERHSRLAVTLTSSRTRHGAYAVENGEKRSVFLIGGIAGAEDAANLSAVEEILLP